MTKPVKNKEAVITSGYGTRVLLDGGTEFHGGIDIAVPGVDNVPIYATCAGRIMAITDASVSCGNAVFVKPTNADFFCLYFHLAFVNPDLYVGSYVDAGDYLGTMGNTGVSRGVHLHYGHRAGMVSGTETFEPSDISSLYNGVGHG